MRPARDDGPRQRRILKAATTTHGQVGSVRHRTADNGDAGSAGTTTRPGGEYKEAQELQRAARTGPGNPPVPALHPERPGNPLSGPSLGRLAIPPSVPLSAWQSPTTLPHCPSLGRLAIPPSVPRSAWQSPTGTLSSLGPAQVSAPTPRQTAAAHQGGYRLLPLELPPRTPRREPQPWSRRHPQPCDPRGRAPLSPQGPATRDTGGDSCPDKDESIEALLAQLRLPPLLSPIKEPAPRPRPGGPKETRATCVRRGAKAHLVCK